MGEIFVIHKFRIKRERHFLYFFTKEDIFVIDTKKKTNIFY